MKAKYFGIMALAALMLTSCGNKLPEGKDLKDLKDATTADSVSNLLGQGQALNYWHMAKSDTLLSSDKGRKDYIDGFLKGLDMVTDNEAYNAGVRDGMQMALQMKQIDKAYEISLNRKAFLEGMSFGLKSDSTVNEQTLQSSLMTIGQRLDMEKQARDAKKAEEALKAYAKKNGMKVSGDYAYKIVKKGDGGNIANGNLISAEVSFTDMKGNELMPSMGAMTIEVGGAGLPQCITNVLEKSTVGSTVEVVTPSTAMRLPAQLDPSELIKANIKIVSFCNEKGDPVSAPENGPQAQKRLEQANNVVIPEQPAKLEKK